LALLILLVIHLGYAQNFEQLSQGEIKSIEIKIGTFLGNWQRNYYGDSAPSSLDILWKLFLGKGKTVISTKIGEKEWAGSGWTGQPLLVRENDELFLIQGAFDHNLKKINATTGEIVWQYKYDDVVKGTGTMWIDRNASNLEESVLIMQGSRRGIENYLDSKFVPSFRAISYFSGTELWRLDVKRTASYSRDVDGSPLIHNDTAYVGLENALFTVFNPGVKYASLKNNYMQPEIYQEIKLYTSADIRRHGGNLVVESSPCRIGNNLYITSGSGHVYGYDLKKRKLNWDFYIGSDIDGSPVVTQDSCLLVTVEKQYIKGNGGVFKLNPAKDVRHSVQWFFPTGNDSIETWEGGVIGSVGTNEQTRGQSHPVLAAFIAIDGYLYVVNHKEIDDRVGLVAGPDSINWYATPRLVYKKKIGPSISTPISIGNKLIAAGYRGIFLFEYDTNMNFSLLDKRTTSTFESTPISYNNRIFIGSRDGYFYCFGEKKDEN
jgi:outer membrane protein assembly factor BamB